MITCLNHGYVKLIGHYGSDETIVESARMSTAKGFQGWPQDEKLLRYLYKHKHTSPFEMVDFTFEVKAPIFLARQFMRHRTWSYSEMSGRYVELPIEFYVPKQWRAQAKTNKQASEGVVDSPEANVAYAKALEACVKAYKALLAAGVAREQARLALPVSLYTTWRGKVNLHNLLGFLSKRLPADAQYEAQVYARAMLDLVRPIVPRTIALFEESHENS